MKVLIVDDDCAALYALSEVLTDVPAQLVLAQSGAAEEHYWRKPLVPERVRAKVMTLVGNAHGHHHQLA